jgi:hypothetical protein
MWNQMDCGRKSISDEFIAATKKGADSALE